MNAKTERKDYERKDYERQDSERKDSKHKDSKHKDSERKDYERKGYERKDFERKDYERASEPVTQEDRRSRSVFLSSLTTAGSDELRDAWQPRQAVLLYTSGSAA
ncbi:hypothetical protein HAZT_HAZT011150, partial [Hyalella azteca]